LTLNGFGDIIERIIMNDEQMRVAKILSECQELLKSNGNESYTEICRQLTLAKHILVTSLIMKAWVESN